MKFDYLKEKKELVSVVLLGVSAVLAVSILVKVTGFFTASARAEKIVTTAVEQNTEDANDIDKYFAKYKMLADALKKNNLFVPTPKKQHPVKEVIGIFGDEVIIRDKLYKVGDKVGDAKIIAIEATKVTIEWDGKKTKFSPIDAGGSSQPGRPRGSRATARGGGPPGAGGGSAQMVTVQSQGRPGGPTGGPGGGMGGFRGFRDMSEADRDRFRAEMQERRERYMNMSEAEREKFRAEMRERMMGGGRSPDDGRGGGERFQNLSKEGAQTEEQRRQMRERFENMSEEERAQMRERMGGRRRGGGERFQNLSEEERVQMEERRRQMMERFQNMSEEERAQMRERFSRRISLSLEQQLKVISEIEKHVAKLKAVVLSIGDNDRGRLRDLSEEERKKLREKIAKVNREKLSAIRAIDQQLAKLRGPARPQQLQPGPERLDRPPRQRPARDIQSSGKRAPQFELNSFDGKTVKLSDYRGKIVVLEWFNMECPFSLYHYKTKNTMAKLAEKYKSKNVVWFAVNSTNHTTPAANKTFAEKYKLAFPILDDRSGKVGRAYGAKTTPHIFVINPRGRIVYDGAIDDSPLGKKKEGVVSYVDNVLAELTTSKAVSTTNTKPYGCTVKYANK
jgi:peroxiredoxin